MLSGLLSHHWWWLLWSSCSNILLHQHSVLHVPTTVTGYALVNTELMLYSVILWSQQCAGVLPHVVVASKQLTENTIPSCRQYGVLGCKEGLELAPPGCSMGTNWRKPSVPHGWRVAAGVICLWGPIWRRLFFLLVRYVGVHVQWSWLWRLESLT